MTLLLVGASYSLTHLLTTPELSDRLPFESNLSEEPEPRGWPPSPNERRTPRGPAVRLAIELPRTLSLTATNSWTNEDWSWIGLYERATVVLTNESPDSIVVVKPGDGSDVGWRTPFVHWFVDHENGRAIHRPTVAQLGRCGNMNPLLAEDIVEVATGESVTFDGWLGDFCVPGPGTYRVTFAYENDPTAPGPVAETTTVLAYSEPVLITIEP